MFLILKHNCPPEIVAIGSHPHNRFLSLQTTSPLGRPFHSGACWIGHRQVEVEEQSSVGFVLLAVALIEQSKLSTGHKVSSINSDILYGYLPSRVCLIKKP